MIFYDIKDTNKKLKFSKENSMYREVNFLGTANAQNKCVSRSVITGLLTQHSANFHPVLHIFLIDVTT